MRRLLRTFAAAAALTFGTAPAGAHEIGTTRATAAIEGGAYRIEIVTDAASLAEKVEAAAGRPRRVAGHTPDAAPVLESFAAVVARRITLSFDGRRSEPRLAFRTAMSNPASIAIELTGAVPPGARTMTWQYGWTFASYAFTVARRDGAASTEWLEGDQESRPVDLAPRDLPRLKPSPLRAVTRYVALGFTHILPGGLDHVLFVVGLFLLTRRPRALLAQISAVTIAHSITLGLSLYRTVSLPSSIVEPLIAVSIAYVAVENLWSAELRPSRVALVFGFGLLHGLGFAGALTELHLPRPEFATALVGFNAGVELGQLTVVAAAFALAGWWTRDAAQYRRYVVVPGSAAIALIAAFWIVQRSV